MIKLYKVKSNFREPIVKFKIIADDNTNNEISHYIQQWQFLRIAQMARGCAGRTRGLPCRARLRCGIWRLCVGIWGGLSSNGWAVLGSARLSQRIHLMSRDWIHLLCRSICFCHTDTSLQFWAWLFSFLTSSEKRNSIEHNLIPSAPALDTCSCFDQSCKVELFLCPAKRKKKKKKKYYSGDEIIF